MNFWQYINILIIILTFCSHVKKKKIKKKIKKLRVKKKKFQIVTHNVTFQGDPYLPSDHRLKVIIMMWFKWTKFHITCKKVGLEVALIVVWSSPKLLNICNLICWIQKTNFHWDQMTHKKVRVNHIGKKKFHYNFVPEIDYIKKTLDIYVTFHIKSKLHFYLVVGSLLWTFPEKP